MGTLKTNKQNRDSNFKSDFYTVEQFIKFTQENKNKVSIFLDGERKNSEVLINNKVLNEVQTVVKSSNNSDYKSGILLVFDNTKAIFIDSLQFFDEWRDVLEGVTSILQALSSSTLLTFNGAPVLLNPAIATDLTKLLQDIEFLKKKLN